MWGRGQASQATVSYAHPFPFREKWVMVEIMNIQMTVQRASTKGDKLSFGMESVRFPGIGASFYGHFTVSFMRVFCFLKKKLSEFSSVRFSGG